MSSIAAGGRGNWAGLGTDRHVKRGREWGDGHGDGDGIGDGDGDGDEDGDGDGDGDGVGVGDEVGWAKGKWRGSLSSTLVFTAPCKYHDV